MAHGDDLGLRLPPAIAPHQVVIVPIGDAQGAATELAGPLRDRGIRVRVDDREDVRGGVKFHEWERKGVPIRVDVGPRDVAAGTATLTRRDSGDRLAPPFGQLADRVVRSWPSSRRACWRRHWRSARPTRSTPRDWPKRAPSWAATAGSCAPAGAETRRAKTG